MRPVIPVADSPIGRWPDRILAALTLAAAAVMVALLASIDPDPRGHGTHEQLGMEPCGWVLVYGEPCPTCGVTTAAAHLVHLSPWRAITTQPFGAGLAAAGIWLAVVAAMALVRGESFVGRVAAWPYGTILVAGLVLFLAGWGYVHLTWDR